MVHISIPALLLAIGVIVFISKNAKNRKLKKGSSRFPRNAVYFLMTSNACGWGDRLVGLSAAIVMARHLRRKLYILWEDLDLLGEMSSLFQPNDRWVYFDRNKEKAYFDYYDFMFVKMEKDVEKMLKKKTPPERGIIIKMNQPYGAIAFGKKGLFQEYSRELFNAYREIRTELFVLREDLAKKWQLDSKERNIGIQVRTGDKAAMGGRSAHCLLESCDYNVFSQKMSDLITAGKEIYLASDDVAFIAEFQRVRGSGVETAGNEENMHFDERNSRGKKESLFKEFYLLASCKTLITSRNSNFGITASYIGNHDSVVFYEFDKGKKTFVFKKYNLKDNPVSKEVTWNDSHDIFERLSKL